MYYSKTSKKRTRNSFIASVVIHVVAVLMTNVSFHIYFPFQKQLEPLVEEESVKVELFSAEVVKKPVFRQASSHLLENKDFSANTSKPKRATAKRNLAKGKPSVGRIKRIPGKGQSIPLGTDVRVSENSDMGLSSASRDATLSPTISKLEVTVKGGVGNKKADENIANVDGDGEGLEAG